VADGWDRRLRRSIHVSDLGDIFSERLVDRPAKGDWRILPAGRDNLHSLEHPEEFRQAAE
jgi:hypothetical protein